MRYRRRSADYTLIRVLQVDDGFEESLSLHEAMHEDGGILVIMSG